MMFYSKNTLFKKNILAEQRGDEQKKKLHVLFIGVDEDIDNSSIAYARKILSSGIITGDIESVSRKEYNSNKLKQLVNVHITDEYDIVVLMCNINDSKKYSYTQTISNLKDAFTEAKRYDAKLICVIGKNDSSNLEINKWIDSVQTYSDDVIDINDSISFNQNDESIQLTDEVQNQIVKELLRIIVNYIKTIDISPGTDTDSKNDYIWILTDLQAQVDAKVVISSLNYGDKENLQWLTTAEAWEEAERDRNIVYKIQMQLSKLKYQLGSRGANGDYNRDTVNAIKKFQEINELPVTGRLDLKTVSRLFYKNAKPADYSPTEKLKAPAQIDVDQAWLKITNKIIDNFEGGYWNNDPTLPAEEKCTNHPYTDMYRNSGETMFGLDRRAGQIDKLIPHGKQFFDVIDAEKDRLGDEFCNVWVWNYRGGDKEEELKVLASKVTKQLYDDYSNRYLSSEALKVVESSKQLLFHFAYAVWNGPAFFQSFAKAINNAVSQGKTGDELIDVAVESRNARFGGTDWAKANTVVTNLIKNDPELKEHKRSIMKNSIFDSSNKNHMRILKEELDRAKKLLREYNESEIWKNLSVDTRRAALISVDMELGPDFADEYAKTDWMQLPDVITNRLDLKRFDIPDNIDPYKLAGFIEQNTSKLPTDAWFKTSVGPKLKTDQLIKLLQSGLTSTKYLTKNVIAMIMSIAPNIDINIDQLKFSGAPGNVYQASQQGDSSIGAPSKNRSGGYWTGD